MAEFWEQKFIDEKTTWGFEPSDSALMAKEFFAGKGIKKILIPGVGYGRNALAFYNHGFDITGIEISQTAINLAKENNLNFPIFCGSVTDMPFDHSKYEGIFCYALIHLLNKYERKKFLAACFNQLLPGGYMIFTVVSKKSEMYGDGRVLSTDRFRVLKGLNVFFYDETSVKREFGDVGLFEFYEMDEPIKHMKDMSPLKCILIKCKKN
ncbi:MAG: class I SAM-dependent methyltransferase [Bacteroidales bacterium]|nr:class I SAM-dependent methyltransferase [Bacteroidales bacterium]